MTVKMYRETGKIEPRTRRMGRITAAAILLILAAGLGLASQNVPPLPKAESILDTFVEKAGGRAAFEKIVSRRTKAELKMPLLAEPGEVTVLVTKAGPYRSVVDTKAIGRFEYGCNGPVVWDINPISGARILEEGEARRFRFLYGLDIPMRWREFFKKVECLGIVRVADKPAFQVQALSHDDYAVTYYFDQASGLLVKIEYPMQTLTGPGKQEIFLNDYRAVSGVLFPYLQVRREAGREMTLTFKSVDYNVEVPEDTLALPEAIRKLSRTGK